MPDGMDDMTPTPEDIIEFELLHAEGHMPKAATPGRLIKALTDAGYIIVDRKEAFVTQEMLDRCKGTGKVAQGPKP